MNINIPKQYFNQEELQNTPKRFNNFLNEFFTRKDFNFTTFPANEYQGKVSTRVKFHSLCSHHLIPFFGEVEIEYVPNELICGLSKLSRTIEFFSKRPQTQEDLTNNIFNFLKDKLEPQELNVRIEARHLCIEMRGIKKDSRTITNLTLNP